MGHSPWRQQQWQEVPWKRNSVNVPKVCLKMFTEARWFESSFFSILVFGFLDIYALNGFTTFIFKPTFKCSSYFEAFALCSTTETKRWCPSLRCIATSRSWVRCHHPTWTHSPALCSRTWTWWGALHAMMRGNFGEGIRRVSKRFEVKTQQSQVMCQIEI